VINVKPKPGEYIRTWEEFQLIPEVVDWIRSFNALELPVIVVTNQRGVARGLMKQADLDRTHEGMRGELERVGARIDDIFCCVHEEARAIVVSRSPEWSWKPPGNGEYRSRALCRPLRYRG
jgi:histidinol phosphatase-like enzyme